MNPGDAKALRFDPVSDAGALQERNKAARGNAPGGRTKSWTALKGRHNAVAPFQGYTGCGPDTPGRCPGLSCCRPLACLPVFQIPFGSDFAFP